MKEFYKKPESYYFIIPILVLIWILTVAFLTLPTAESRFGRAAQDRDKIQGYVTTILSIDRDRLKYKELVNKTGKFDYAVVIDNFVQLHGIKTSDYTPQIQGPNKRGKQLTQIANITIKSIGIEKFAKFLSSLQRSWPNLQCDTLTLKKEKTALDSWEAKMKFTYVFKSK
jgi:hypothetical protein